MSTRAVWLMATGCIVVLAVFFWRPLDAWWLDDTGNRALLRGQNAQAAGEFEVALRQEPGWAMLHEDLGRAVIGTNPSQALQEFERADCGSPCAAEAGDALMALGRTNEAIDRYIQAKALEKVSQAATQLASAGKYDAALAVETALLSRLHNDFVDRSELAAVYAEIGKLDVAAASRTPGNSASRARAEQGIAALGHATDLAPLNEDYLLSYGFAQLKFGDAAQARTTFERILELHPGQKDASDALARMGTRGER